MSHTSISTGSPPPWGTYLKNTVPPAGSVMSAASKRSAKAWRATTIGLTQPGTSRGMFLQMIGWRNSVPPIRLRVVALGDFHAFLSPNSFTRA